MMTCTYNFYFSPLNIRIPRWENYNARLLQQILNISVIPQSLFMELIRYTKNLQVIINKITYVQVYDVSEYLVSEHMYQ